MGRRARRAKVAILLAVVIACLHATEAGASSGEITQAATTPDWTVGSVAGSVAWTGCEHTPPPQRPTKPPYPWEPELSSQLDEEPYCGWSPYVTVGQGADPTECSDPERRLPSLGSDVALVWTGGERRWLGNLAFEVSEIPLVGGKPQLACLSVVETAPTAVACIQMVGAECPPFVMADFFHVFDAALLEGPAQQGQPARIDVSPGVPAPTFRGRPRCRTKPNAPGTQRPKACGKKHRGFRRNEPLRSN